MDILLPVLVQDKMSKQYAGVDPVGHVLIRSENVLLNGPVSRRVAVLDFNPKTGALETGAEFLPPAPPGVRGKYHVTDEKDLSSNDLNQVAVFAAVMKTMAMFEQPDTLGRPLVWGFGAPQLLVVPRAGRWANAFYERNSHSLQFFFFENPRQAGDTIYTSMSRDIVAHETGHAILDGIAPYLYNAITPQSLALHEGIADLVALMVAFSSEKLCKAVLTQTDGSIESSTPFSSVAEEFGRALDATGKVGYLRNLYNQKTLDPNDQTKDPAGKPNLVIRYEPHELCQVMTGALYTVLINIHNTLRDDYLKTPGISKEQAASTALGIAVDRFCRMTLRALDLLPPGEVSFADYARAIIAADQASYPKSKDENERNWIRKEFTKRKIVPDEKSLELETDFEHPAVKNLDLQNLIDSDWAAYQFANHRTGRELLSIPSDASFHVEPRQKVTKTYKHLDGDSKITECIFKVFWDTTESNPIGSSFPVARRLRVGTTLAIDWDTHKVRSLITSDPNKRPEEADQQSKDRDLYLTSLAMEGILVPARFGCGADGIELCSVIGADDLNGVMRVQNTARTLHIIRRR